MKKFICIFSLLFFLSFSMNSASVFASTSPKTLTQGIYNVRDANLLVGTSLTARVTPTTGRAIILVVASDQTIESLIRLNPEVPQQVLPPLKFDYSLIIYGDGAVLLS
ncbi:hypothetical protein [Clostridium beijerinckii]|uniref:hypothetical protein n=1 Tax=Clostridium beijerinckii TaxID=1520 RepID=UPI00232E8DD4|nr:hypothetical protein [Clostridium beijerinckii]